MSAVSYQSILPAAEEPVGVARFEPLPDGTIDTRRKDARRSITIAVSKAQRRWLREVASVAGKGIDEDAVVRALLDLGRELPIDWALLAGAGSVRAAVRESVGTRTTR